MTRSQLPDFPRQRAAELLGYCGLIPFAAGAIAALWEGGTGVLTLSVVLYGAIITSFMAGGVWLAGLQASQTPAQLIGIGIGLLSWFAALGAVLRGPFVAAPVAIFLAASLLVLFFAERRADFWPLWYRTLRWRLTLGASASLLVTGIAPFI